MSYLDKDSGVREIPVPRCPLCHTAVYFTANGTLNHTDPNNRCTYSS